MNQVGSKCSQLFCNDGKKVSVKNYVNALAPDRLKSSFSMRA
jgi:hypothetical protein